MTYATIQEIRKLKAFFVWPIVAALVWATTASAADYTSVQGRYKLRVPDRWTVEESKEFHDIVSIMSPKFSDIFSMCTIHAAKDAATQGSTQAEIDAAFKGMMTAQDWAELLKAAGYQQVAIEQAGDETQDGRLTQFVIATYLEAGDPTKIKAVVHRTPGRRAMIFCGCITPAYASEAVDYATIFTSFTPLEGLIAMGPPARTPYAHLSSRIPALYASDRSANFSAAHRRKAITARP